MIEAQWTHTELTTPAVHEAVWRAHRLAYATTLTVLQRLARNGLVSRREGRRSHIYASAITREEFAARRGVSLASTLVDIGVDGVAAFLADTERLDPRLIAALRKRLRVSG